MDKKIKQARLYKLKYFIYTLSYFHLIYYNQQDDMFTHTTKKTMASVVRHASSILVGFLFIVTPFNFALSQKVSNIQSQINELLITIKSLQTQLNILQGGVISTTTTKFIFTTNLKLGGRGAEVLQLQKILNSDPDTIITNTGPGSTGNETNYFGKLTKTAVIKFQNKYASEILTPVGLLTGTGYVGPSTRARLNKISSIPITTKVQTNKAVETTKGQPVIVNTVQKQPLLKSTGFVSDDIYIMFPSRYYGSVGTKVSYQGTGFIKAGNRVMFDDTVIAKNLIPSRNGSITFFIPKWAKLGKHKVWVKNEKGVSKNNTFFIVTSPSAIVPIISKITPTIVKYGDAITIHGSGFTKNGNSARLSYKVIDKLTSVDGKTINIKVTPEIFKKINYPQKNTKFDFWVTIDNKNGVSNSGQFVFSI